MTTLPISGAPFACGLSFVPAATLAPLIGSPRDPAADLVDACVELRASFAFVPAGEPWAERACEALAEADIAPMWAVDGPLWPVVRRHGITEGLRATLTDSEHIGREIEDGLAGLAAEVARGMRSGARAFVIAEDLAGSRGPLVAPDFAIAELVPRYGQLVEAASLLGMPSVLHSDGDIRPLLPAIVKAGFSAVHAGGGLDFEAFGRLFWAVRESGLAFIGGLQTPELANAARAEALGSKIGVLARAGGLLVADDGGITTAVEVAGLVTALAAARAA